MWASGHFANHRSFAKIIGGMMSISAHAKRFMAIFTSSLLLAGGINLAGAPPPVIADSATLQLGAWQFKITTDGRFMRTNTDDTGWAVAFLNSAGSQIIWVDLAVSPDGTKLVVAGLGGQLITFNGSSWAQGRQLADTDADPASTAVVLFTEVTDVQIANSGTVTINGTVAVNTIGSAGVEFEPIPHAPLLAQTYFDRVLVFSFVQAEPTPSPSPSAEVIRTPTEEVVRIADPPPEVATQAPTQISAPTPTPAPPAAALAAPTAAPTPRLTSKITLPASSAKYCSVKPIIKKRAITAYRVTSKRASANGCRITLTMATKAGIAVSKKLFVVPTKSHRNKKPTTSYIQLSGKLVIG